MSKCDICGEDMMVEYEDGVVSYQCCRHSEKEFVEWMRKNG